MIIINKIHNCEERMGEFEGGEERKISSPIHNMI
jgi:hypothetical protein